MSCECGAEGLASRRSSSISDPSGRGKRLILTGPCSRASAFSELIACGVILSSRIPSSSIAFALILGASVFFDTVAICATAGRESDAIANPVMGRKWGDFIDVALNRCSWRRPNVAPLIASSVLLR